MENTVVIRQFWAVEFGKESWDKKNWITKEKINAALAKASAIGRNFFNLFRQGQESQTPQLTIILNH